MRRRCRFLSLLAAFFVIAPHSGVEARPARTRRPPSRPTAAARPSTRAMVAESARYGVYFQNARIGSMISRTLPSTHESRPAVRMEVESDMKLAALGGVVEIQLDVSHVLDSGGRPLVTRQHSVSMGRTTTVVAHYYPDRIVCDLDASGAKSEKVVPIPKGVSLSVDPQSGGAQPEKLAVGQKSTLHFFDPTTLSIIRVDTSVARSEMRTRAGKPVRAYLMQSRDSLTGASESWVDQQGRMLESNSTALGLRIVREDVPGPSNALAYAPPKDFAVATSVQTAVKLPDARKTEMLRLRIRGIPDSGLLLRDARQQVAGEEKSGDRLAAVFTVTARDLPAVCLPAAAAGATGPGLGDAPFLGATDAAVQKQAREIAESETNRGVLARRIRAWVKGHMQKPSNIATPRSAAEIMQSREGVCRDYATLFAALARTVGVPTRICAGLVYFQDGFFYHAWVECQLTDGPDGWFAFDPTLDDDFVDATHIKFGQGDPTDMYAAVRLVGQIQAEILEHRSLGEGK